MTEAQSLRQRANAALYPTAKPAAPSAKAPPADKFATKTRNGERLYGSNYDRALRSFHDRFEAAHREDREALTHSRQGRAQHEAFFKRLNMDPRDAQLGLGKLLEYEQLPRDLDTQQKIAAKTFEALRMELGDSGEANAAIAAHNKFMAAYAEAVPYFAQRAREHGANLDADIVRLGAHYGAALK
jgi:hypothetical protein